tara:strand:- start:119 stop:829 length:711 start_codon:yes stop_codon:yes gene_type:complete
MEAIKVSDRSKEKVNTKTLLKNNLVPCVIYGKDYKTASLAIDSKIIQLLIKDTSFYSRILSINLNGTIEKVLPKEVQYHPVTDNVIHVDFMKVQETTKVTVDVPVNFLNKEKSPGIKLGGVLNIVRRQVELTCNASNIPEILEFDLIESEIGDSIKISNIKLPENVKPTITDRDFVIATLVPPTVEAEPTPEEGEKTEEDAGEDTKSAEGEEKKEKGDEKGTETSKETKDSKEEKK